MEKKQLQNNNFVGVFIISEVLHSDEDVGSIMGSSFDHQNFKEINLPFFFFVSTFLRDNSRRIPPLSVSFLLE